MIALCLMGIGAAIGGLAMQVWMLGTQERCRKLWQRQMDLICATWDRECEDWDRRLHHELSIWRATWGYERAQRAKAERQVAELREEAARKN